jgi:hypothetical protein
MTQEFKNVCMVCQCENDVQCGKCSENEKEILKLRKTIDSIHDLIFATFLTDKEKVKLIEDKLDKFY